MASDYIITPDVSTEFYDPDNFLKKFKTFAKNELGDDEIKFHTLRHTYCTRWVECGLNDTMLMKQAGHKQFAFTVDKYCKVDQAYTLETNDYSEFLTNSALRLKADIQENQFGNQNRTR